jgi:hypothetical protein
MNKGQIYSGLLENFVPSGVVAIKEDYTPRN